jgi:VanZ family protein
LKLAVNKRWLVVALVLWWVAMFTATHIPGPNLPSTGVSDKTEHYLAYGILGFLLCSVLLNRNICWHRSAVYTIVICTIYGAIDETTQPYFNRAMDFYDWVADVVGAISGVVIRSILHLVFRKRSESPASARTT